jgi:hypothetical protein
LFLQELGELSAGVLASMVGPKTFDPDSVLCVCPRRKGFVGIKRLVLGAEDLEAAVTSVIIREGNIIFPPS